MTFNRYLVNNDSVIFNINLSCDMKLWVLSTMQIHVPEKKKEIAFIVSQLGHNCILSQLGYIWLGTKP